MSYYYWLGGNVPLDSPTYVGRKADDDLYRELLKGSFCYVLTSRQMGKSSLKVRTKAKLEEKKIRCVTIDLTGIGSHDSTANSWYRGISKKIVDQLKLQNKIDIKAFWKEHSELSPLNKLSVFMEEILSQHITESLVIFLDEIDSTIRLDFTDDFFAWIRYCYQSREDNTDSYYKRLTFCLLGVAKPEDLMKDKERTPFNIGKSIELLPFEEGQLEPLMDGLREKATDLDKVRHKIQYWTGGQPFLTQRLCQLIQSELETIEPGSEAESIEKLVESKIIDNWEFESDENAHLSTIQARLLKDEDKAISLLGLYQRILKSGELAEGVTSKDNLSEIATLRLAGLVVSVRGRLLVYNEIYKRVFNTAWIERELERLRIYAESLNLWLESGRDDKYLLTGQAFFNAQEWSLTRRLTEVDSQYLAASQKLETETVKAKAQQIIEKTIAEAEKKIEKAEAEAKKITTKAAKRATIFTVGSVAISLVAVGIAWVTYNELTWRSRIERESTEALSLPPGSLARSIAAIRVGRELQRKVKGAPLAEYPLYSPLAALQETDSNNWQETNRLNNHGVGVGIIAVAMSADGQTIVSGSQDGAKVNVWRRDGTLISTLTSHQGDISTVGISGDGNTIVAGIRVQVVPGTPLDGLFPLNSTVQVWRRDGTLISTLPNHQDGVSAVAVSADGNTIVSGSHDKTVKVWRRDGSLITTLTGHRSGREYRVTGVAMSADGNTIMSGYFDGTVKVWRRDGVLITTLTGHPRVSGVAISGDGNTIVSASRDTVKVWQRNGTLITTLTDRRDVTGVAISADGNTIAIAAGGLARLQVWRRRDGSVITLAPHALAVHGVAMSADGNTLVSGDEYRTVKVWRWNGSFINTVTAYPDKAWRLAISRDGNTIASGNRDGIVKIWRRDGSPIATFTGHQDIVAGVEISGDGNTIVSWSLDKTMKIWRRDGSPIATFTNLVPFSGVAISTDGNTIVFQHQYDTLKIWKLDDRIITDLPLIPVNNFLKTVAVSGDGNTIVCGYFDETVKVWRRDGSLITTLTGNQDAVEKVAIDRDGNTIVFGSRDRAKIWRRDDSLVATLTGHEGLVRDVAVSGDGNMIVSGSSDRTVKIWRRDGSLITTLTTEVNGVTQVAMSDDGKTLIFLDYDGNIKIWHFDLDYLLAERCQVVKDYLKTHPEENKDGMCPP
jgi:WD40 repeat protein